MNNVLVVGSGAREHAILKALSQRNSPAISLHCIGTNHNPGIKSIVKQFIIYESSEQVMDFCISENIKLSIIGPEKYLAEGIVDLLEFANIPCIGPNESMARIETDKNYARNLMRGLDVNPNYRHFPSLDTKEDIVNYIDFIGTLDYSYVIKPTGLCSGKGVMVSGLHFTNDIEGLKYAISTKGPLLIEEKFVGDEFTLMSYTDGRHFSHMPIVKDYKLLEDGDTGPNTGSMGCITYSDHSMPFLTDRDIANAREYNEIAVKRLSNDSGNRLYCGIIYGSYIKLHGSGEIKLIEYNCRYGDPECINVLELLDTNLLDIYTAMVSTQLDKCVVEYKSANIISKYLVPNYYPHTKITEPFYNIDLDWYMKHSDNIICSSMNGMTTTNSRTLVYYGLGGLGGLSASINAALEPMSNYFKFRRDIGGSGATYAASGVDIAKSTSIVSAMGPYVSETLNANVIHEQGDFSGIIDIPKEYRDPVLIASIDGVGSKSSFLSKLLGPTSYINSGKDIVGHSINDTLVKGAKPYFMLDYIACDKLNDENIINIVKGMSEVCAIYDCPILGGETAEMPKIYNDNEIDIVGSIVGIAERSKLVNGKRDISCGDIVVGLPSMGLHTNGFSLIRALDAESNAIATDPEMMEWLSQPHKCYYDEIQLLDDNSVHYNGLIHITGGGLLDNPPRVLAEDKKILFSTNDLKTADDHHFRKIQKLGNINTDEMRRTFNCGIGFMIIMNEPNYYLLRKLFGRNGIEFHMIGCVLERVGNEPQVAFT